MNEANGGWSPLERKVPSDLFRAEVAAWAARIGVAPKQVQLRPMTRKWGSCSTSGRVSFDTELLLQPAAFRRKVIVHELLHLKVPNHGAVFRALLRAYLGDESPLPPRKTCRRSGKNCRSQVKVQT